jgi:hypothetical protein
MSYLLTGTTMTPNELKNALSTRHRSCPLPHDDQDKSNDPNH